MIVSIFWIGLGSFFGGIGRFLLSKIIQGQFPGAFPWGTFAVNVIGCFLIGLFYGFSEKGLGENARLFLTIGFCGGFTTFSTFANESLQLFKSGNLIPLALYASASVFVGIIAVYAGNWTTKLF